MKKIYVTLTTDIALEVEDDFPITEDDILKEIDSRSNIPFDCTEIHRVYDKDGYTIERF